MRAKTLNFKNLLGLAFLVLIFFLPLMFWPSLNDQYTVAKWQLLHFFSALFCLLICARIVFDSSSEFKIKLPYFVLSGFVFIVALQTFSLWVSDFAFWRTRLMDWSTGVSVALCTYFCLSEMKSKHDHFWTLIAITSILVSAVGILQIFGLNLLPNSLWRNDFPSSTFGFQNMTAEFLGISFVLIFCKLAFKRTQNKLYFVSLSFCAFYLPSLSSRASALGILTALILGWRYFPVGIAKYKLLVISVLISVFGFFISRANLPNLMRSTNIFESSLNQNYSPAESAKKPQIDDNSVAAPTEKSHLPSQNLIQTKNENSKIRKARWLNTLQMIRERPLGIGPHRFEYGYVPFSSSVEKDIETHEGMIPKSPHNSYLELLAEDGLVVGTLFFLIFAVLFVKTLRTSVSTEENKLIKSGVLVVWGFIAADALVAFPMENALPFLFFSISVGAALQLISTQDLGKYLQQTRLVKPLFCAFALLFTPFAFSQVYSSFLAHNTDSSISDFQLACKINPEKLDACLSIAAAFVNGGKFENALSILESNLSRQPNHFPSMKLYAEIMLQKGEMENACHAYTTFNNLFGGESSVKEIHTSFCAK